MLVACIDSRAPARLASMPTAPRGSPCQLTTAACFALSSSARSCRCSSPAGVVAFVGLPYVDRLLRDWFSADVQLRARLVMSSLEDTLPSLVARDIDQGALRRFATKVTLDANGSSVS